MRTHCDETPPRPKGSRLSSDEVRALRSMFGKTEIFDPAGYWSPAREEAAVRQPHQPAVNSTK